MTNVNLVALTFFVDVYGDVTKRILSGGGSGSIASARLQMQPAIQAASRLGFKIKALSLHSSHPKDFLETETAEICLVGKMSANSDDLIESMVTANLAYLSRSKNRGSQIVVQYCDNLIQKKGLIGEFHKDLLYMADHVIYPSNKLKELSFKYLNKNAGSTIIKDPWQIERFHRTREINPSKTLKLIWFGSHANILYLMKELPKLLSLKIKNSQIQLTILGHSQSLRLIEKFYRLNKDKFSGWAFRLILWNPSMQPKQLEEELSSAHIAIIPSDPNDPLKSGASHNRLVDAIRAGCITIASEMDSYKELSDFAILGNSVAELLPKAIVEYEALSKKINSQSEKQLSEFSPNANNASWTNFFALHASS